MASNFNINKITLDNNSESAEILIGNTAPTVGPVSADPGSLFIVANPAGSSLYINTSATTPGTTWTLFGLAGAGGDHQTLANLAWTSSLHTGTSGAIAAFNGAGTSVDLTGSLGEILYHDGSAWVVLSPGLTGQVLEINVSGLPSWAAPSSGTVTDLQTAYDGGNTIDVNSSVGNIEFTLTSANFVVNGPGNANFGFTGTDLTTFGVGTGTFDVDATGAITLDAGAASNFTTSAGTLTLDGAGGVNIAGNNAEIDLTTTDLIDINAGTVDLDAGTVDLDATSFSIDGTSTSNVTVTGNDLTISTLSTGLVNIDGIGGISLQGNAAEIDLTTIGPVDINSGAGTWDASTLDITATSTVDVTGTVVAVDSTAGAITLDAVGGGISLDGAAASNFTTSAGALTLDGNGGVTIEGNTGPVDVNSGAGTWDASTLSLTSTGLLDINAGANMDVDVTGTFDLLSTSTFSIDGTGASNVTVDSGSLTLSTTTTGAIILSSSDNIDIDAVNGVTIDGSGASSFTIDSGDLTISTTNSGTVVLQGIDPVEINRVSGLNTEIVKLTQTTSGLNFGIFAGTADPSGIVTADAGDLFIRVDGSSSEMYQNTSSPSPGNTWSQFAIGVDLQTAYVAGNTITTSAAEGPVVITGDQTLQVTTSAGLDVDTIANFDVTTFDVQMTGTNGFSIDGTDASNVTTSSGDLTLSATANSVVIDGGEAATDAVTITASNAAGGIDINAGTGGITIDAAAASSFTTSAGALTLDGASGVTIEGNAGAVDVNSGVGTWDASSLALTTTGLLDLNAGANMDVDVTGTFDLLSTGTFSIDGTGASNVTANVGDLTLSTTTSGEVLVDGIDGVEINSSAGVIDIGNDAVSQPINIGTGAAARTITIGNATGATALDIDSGTGGITIDSAGDISFTSDGISIAAATWALDYTTSAIITDSSVGEGLKYAADYSGTFVDESLVTKKFVDSGFVAINQVNGVVYVDAIDGDDGTGAPYRNDKPFLTIAAAVAASAAGDTIMIRPGTYAEWGISIPTNRTVRGEGSWQTVIIGSTAATGDVFTVTAEVTITDVTIQLATAPHKGISFTGVASTDTFGMYNIRFLGDGATGSGIGVYKNGPGKVIGAEIRWDIGGFDAGMQCDEGSIALESLHFPSSAGTVNCAARGFNGGRLQLADLNVGNPNVINGLEATASVLPDPPAAPTILVYGVNFFNLQNAVFIECDGTFVGLYGGKIQDQFFDFKIDSACDGINPTIGNKTTVQSTAALQSKFDFPFAALATDFALNYLVEATGTERSASVLLGGDLVSGFPELGSTLWSGSGRPYNLGCTFFSTDNTASSISDGGNLTNITAELASLSGSTATFQGIAPGHSILWTVSRRDVNGDYLKYFGVDILQDIAASGGQFVFEIQDASNSWVEVPVECLSKNENYRYSNSVFLRSSSEESIIFGIDNDTTWPETTINGVTGRWARIRITSAPTTLPTFEQIKVIGTATNLNQNGYRSAFGLAQWKRSVSAVGNVFSESGSVTNSTTLVGTGAGSWTHVIQNSDLDNTTKFVDTQIIIPNGLCTAYPLFISIYYYTKEASGGGSGTSTVTAPCTFTVDAIPKQVAGIEVADAGGAVVPVERSYANTETINTGTPFSQTLNASNIGDVIAQAGGNDNKTRKLTFGPIFIDDYYEGDAVYFRGIITSQGTPTQAVFILGVDIEGTAFSDGRPIG